MSALGEQPTVHETCRVRDSVLGSWTDVGLRTTLVESAFGDYTYTVVAGVPARPLRERFPAAVAERLQAIAWWDWSRDVLEARSADLNDLDLFLERYG